MFGQFVMSKFASIALAGLSPGTRFTSSASSMGSATGAASVAENRRENRQSPLVRLLKKAMLTSLRILSLSSMNSKLQDADNVNDEIVVIIKILTTRVHSSYLSFSTCPGLFRIVRFSLILLKIS
jgi:hypothetical protein